MACDQSDCERLVPILFSSNLVDWTFDESVEIRERENGDRDTE
ncbi:hypothetical protein [Halomontanus rarus]